MEKTQWYIGAPNGVILCINQNNEGELGGEFFHSYSEAPVPFQGIGQMTLRMEKLYDWLRFPHPGTNSRSFGEMPKPDGRIHERKRKGRITWMEEDRTIQFRSVWEMIKLIESAVDSVSQEDGEEINWFPEEDQPGQNA